MLEGKKTYIIAAALGVLAFVKAMGWIDETLYQTLLGFLAAGGLGTLAAKNNRIESKVDETTARSLPVRHDSYDSEKSRSKY